MCQQTLKLRVNLCFYLFFITLESSSSYASSQDAANNGQSKKIAGFASDCSYSFEKAAEESSQIKPEVPKIEDRYSSLEQSEVTENSNNFASLGISLSPLSKSSSDFHRSSYLTDQLALSWLKTQTQQGFVTLLLPDLTSDSVRRAKVAAVLEFVSAKNLSVVYDADSSSAALVRSVFGNRAIGITALISATPLWSEDISVLRIINPYLRLMAFQTTEIVIAAKESSAGLATIINNAATHFTIMGTDVKSPEYFNAWRPSQREPALGFNIATPIKMKLKQQSKITVPSRFNLSQVEKSLRLFEFGKFSNQSDAYQQAMVDLKMTKNSSLFGAVIFGSSSYPGNYTDLVYQVAWKLGRAGIPVVTGGAGGVMEIANQGAFNAGGASIGINLGGRLFSEKETASEVQTLSISVSNYEQRIPLLLRGKRLVIFAPGGSGTMKELATTLLLFGKDQEMPDLVFLGEYYKPLLEGLAPLLSEKIRKKIHLVDSINHFSDLMKSLKENWIQSGVENRVADLSFSEPTRKNQNRFKRAFYTSWRESSDSDQPTSKPKSSFEPVLKILTPKKHEDKTKKRGGRDHYKTSEKIPPLHESVSRPFSFWEWVGSLW